MHISCTLKINGVFYQPEGFEFLNSKCVVPYYAVVMERHSLYTGVLPPGENHSIS
jgi:hypothetical protein